MIQIIPVITVHLNLPHTKAALATLKTNMNYANSTQNITKHRLSVGQSWANINLAHEK